MVVISHAFNNIFTDQEDMETILKPYLEQKEIFPKDIDYSELRLWLSQSDPLTLKGIAISIIELYFV
jgi:hypothetical protein